MTTLKKWNPFTTKLAAIFEHMLPLDQRNASGGNNRLHLQPRNVCRLCTDKHIFSVHEVQRSLRSKFKCMNRERIMNYSLSFFFPVHFSSHESCFFFVRSCSDGAILRSRGVALLVGVVVMPPAATNGGWQFMHHVPGINQILTKNCMYTKSTGCVDGLAGE